MPYGKPAQGTRRARRPDPSTLPLDEQVEAAREAALRLLAVRERSSADLRTRLRQKGYSAEAVTRVVSRLVETGLQDDSRYAESYAEAARGRGVASRRVGLELRARGVEIDAAVAASTSRPEDEAARARALAVRRASSLAGLPPEVRARRLSGFLARRGYPSDLVQAIVSDVCLVDDDDRS